MQIISLAAVSEKKCGLIAVEATRAWAAKISFERNGKPLAQNG